MVEENRCQSRGGLLDDIKRGSKLLERQLLRFIYWVGDRKIISFVEMQQTKKLQKVREISLAASSSNGLWHLLVFPAFIAPLNTAPKQHPSRKYMQGPVVKAQHPSLPLQERGKEQAKYPHAAFR